MSRRRSGEQKGDNHVDNHYRGAYSRHSSLLILLSNQLP